MLKLKKKGFTLIELLVVIAIIGILSSVVLASLNTARIKGKDANISGTLNGIRAQAELYYDDTSNTYGTGPTMDATCGAAAAGTLPADPTIAGQIDGIYEQVTSGEEMECNSDEGYYVIAAPRVGGVAGDYYCIDSTGYSGEINFTTANAATDVTCVGATNSFDSN